MKHVVAKVLLGLPGLFILTTGLVFLLNPEAAADKLALATQGSEGLSNIRGMAGAPLFAVGSTLLLAAITSNLQYARPAAIFLVTLIASRVLSYVVDGPNAAIAYFIAVPTVAFGLMLAGHRLLDAVKPEREAEPAAGRPQPSV